MNDPWTALYSKQTESTSLVQKYFSFLVNVVLQYIHQEKISKLDF